MNGDVGRRAERLLAAARAANCTVSFAESCTGGLVAGALTALAGSSEVFLGSAVTYALSAKTAILGVPQAVLDDHGAVSSECAEAMAEGALRVFGSDVAVSVTGIAGPGGEEPGKPVGTVWFGVSARGGVRSCVEHFRGSREEVREAAVCKALALAAQACHA